MATADSSKPASEAPWHAAYPAPKSEVATISREEVLEMLKTTPLEKRDFILVDLRRNDFAVSQQERENNRACCARLATMLFPFVGPSREQFP
jgi:hypothetical protein